MAADGLDLGDLDTALDGLVSDETQGTDPSKELQASKDDSVEETKQAEPEEPQESVLGEESAQPQTPPKLKARRRTDIWEGRQNFDGLFDVDSSSLPSARGGPEEKVEYFREKLKRAEAMTARFRDAWSERDREIDILERLLERDKQDVDVWRQKTLALVEQKDTLESFLAQKKEEFLEYGKKVQTAFQRHEDDTRELQAAVEREKTHAQIEKDKTQALENSLSEYRQKLEAEKEASAQANQAHNETQTRLNQEIQGHKKTLLERVEEIAKLGEVLDTAKEEAARAQDQSQEDAKQLEALRVELQAAQEHGRSQEEALQADKSSIERLKAAVGQQREALEVRDKGLQEHKTKLKEKSKAYDTLAQTHAQLEADLDAAKKQSIALQERAEALAAESQQEHAALGGLQKKYASLEKEHASLGSKHTSLEKEHASLSSKLTSLEKEHASLGSKHTSLEKEHASLDSQHTSSQQEHASLRKQYVSLEKGHASLDKKHASLEKEHASLKDAHASAEKKYASLEAKHVSLEKEYASQNEAQQKYQKHLKAQKEQLNALESQLKSQQSAYNNLAQTHGECDGHIKALEVKLLDAQKECAKQSDLVAKTNQASLEAQKQLKGSGADVAAWKEKATSLADELRDAVSLAQARQSELETLQKTYDAVGGRIRKALRVAQKTLASSDEPSQESSQEPG